MKNSDNSFNAFLQNKTLRVAVIVVGIILLLAFVTNLIGSKQQKAPPQTESKKSKDTLVPTVSKKSNRAEGQIIVKFKAGISDTIINQHLQPLGAKIERKIEGINTTVVSVPRGKEDFVLSALAKDSITQYAEPDYIQTVQFVPNDTDYKNQWALANNGLSVNGVRGTAANDINVEPAWDVTKGNGVKIAIIDTGIDLTHPDLAGKVVAQKVFTTTSIDDKFGHGTHVAGIIAANTNNSQGIAGVCPDCQLIIAKAMNDSGLGVNSTLAEAMTWAADNGAKVINMSEGGSDSSQAQADAVAYAWSKGAIVIAAAGNNNSNAQFYPAALPNVVSVASSDNTDKRSSFSNYGTWVNVAAPGTAIYSTLPTKVFAMQAQDDLALNYDYLSGTSMATPVVSGVAGLIWASSYGTSNQSVVDRLLKTADKITGTGQYWENGRINASAAVGPVPTIAPTTAPTVPPTTAATIVPSTAPTDTTVLTPTLYCLGSCPTLPVSETPTPTTAVGTSPIASIDPSGATIAPTTPDSVEPTVDPCAGTESIEVAHNRHHHRKHHGWLSGWMDGLLEFLKQLIELIKQLLGLGGGSTPTPTPEPCPTATPLPDETEPTGMEITVVPTTADQPTVAPTVAPTTAGQPTVAPTIAPGTGTNPSGEAMPSGDIAGWKQIFADDFTATIPVGAFSDCDNNTDTPQATCNGLQPYPEYYANWWAYPNTWSDTAKSGADGNTGAPFGGVYHPEDTVSVDSGVMHVKMFRPAAGGDNHVAALVPRKCMDQQFGRYIERFKVVQADPGFKSAHLFYGGGFEIDYPEDDYGGGISAYTHPGGGNFNTGAKWTEWHTTVIEWTAGKTVFYLDGKEIGTATNQVPNLPLSWILQNESSIMGPYADPGATAQLDTDWVACYTPA